MIPITCNKCIHCNAAEAENAKISADLVLRLKNLRNKEVSYETKEWMKYLREMKAEAAEMGNWAEVERLRKAIAFNSHQRLKVYT